MHFPHVAKSDDYKQPHDTITLNSGGFVADFYDLKLSSAYQPIFSFAHRRPVGYEALLRAHLPNNEPILPNKILSFIRGREEIIQLDLLAREIHARNFVSQRPENSWLFINVSPDVFVGAPRQSGITSSLPLTNRLAPNRVVIEVVESAIADEVALVDAVQYYRDQGCLIALDDFGAGHSNFGRVWSIEPDIVKLDRRLTQQAYASKKSRRMLANLVAMLHESGSLVLMEGVETEAEAMTAMASDIDLVQGYFFGHPKAIIPDPDSYPIIPSDLNCKYRDQHTRCEHAKDRQKIAWPLLAFQESAKALESTQSLDAACGHLLKHDGVECSYLLTDEGVQIGRHVNSSSALKVCDPRYAPLFETTGANWFRRPFFQDAINNPGHVQVSRPYLSLTGSYMCVTFSIVVQYAGQTHVLCCDLNWGRLEGELRAPAK